MKLLGTLLAIGLLTPGVASADTDDVVVVHEPDTTDVRDYWTPERIAAMPVGEVDAPGSPPVDDPTGAGVSPPNATVGRLFFVSRGEDSSCTATVVLSANRATAVTAGHCVHGFDLIGNDPQWTDKLLFVPGFRDNTMPFGSYVVDKVVAHREWVADDQKSEYDQAFLVLDRPAALGQAIGIGLPGGLPSTQLGYPRTAGQPGHQGRPEFTGQRLARCWGTPLEDLGSPQWPGDHLWGVPCDMGGGSSGGPRLAFFNDQLGRGVVTGVNTQSAYLDDFGNGCDDPDDTRCDTRHLVGPQFSKEITAPLYEFAQAA